MQLSREAKLVSAITLLAAPTIMYGGLVLLNILTNNVAGPGPAPVELNETQWALWRAGHAHAGVWVILSLVAQMLIDSATLGRCWMWCARIGAPLAAVLVSGGFFGLAFFPAFRWLLYAGAVLLVLSLAITAIGLLKKAPAAA